MFQRFQRYRQVLAFDLDRMDIDDFLPPLPLEPPDDFGLDQGRAPPPPPPLQTSCDAEVMDVGSGGDGYTSTPGEGEATSQQPISSSLLSFCSHFSDEATSNPPCPRTARHAPQVTKFLPDLKLLRDVKISVSFTEGSTSSNSSSNSKDRKVLYTGEGQEAGRQDGLALGSLDYNLHDPSSLLEEAEGSYGAGDPAVRKSEAEVDLENKVEFAVLDELDDFYENLLDQDDDEPGGFKSDTIVQQEQVDDEAAAFSYEVRLSLCYRSLCLSAVNLDCSFFSRTKRSPPTTIQTNFALDSVLCKDFDEIIAIKITRF